MNERPYTKPGRLVDVLALIQVLALDEHRHRSRDGVLKELQEPPSSSESWVNLAAEHPEFFRVAKTGDHPLSLVARHVWPEEREFPSEFTYRLLQTAIDLHDRQVRAAERWTYLIPLWAPMIGGIVAGVFALVAVWFKGYLHLP